MTAEERAFVQGAAVALGILGRAGHNRPGTAADIAREMGLTLAEFKRARCEPYDLKPFRRELRRLEERARATRPDTTQEALAAQIAGPA